MLTLRDALSLLVVVLELALLVLGFACSLRGDLAVSTNLFVLACYLHLVGARNA